MDEERLTKIDRSKNAKSRGPLGLLGVMWVLGIITWQPSGYDFHQDVFTAKRPDGKRLLLSLSSLFNPLSLTIVSFLSVTSYFTCFFGRIDHFLRFFSYICYWLSTTTPQIVCTIACLRNFRRVIRRKGDITWVHVFDGNSLLNQFSDLSQIKCPPKVGTLVIFLFFAFSVASLKVIYFIAMGENCRDLTEYVWMIRDVLHWPFFACFCYYLYLQRILLEERVNTTFVFISNNVGKLNDCMSESRELFQNYLQLRNLLLPWLRIILFSSSFGVTLFFTWNYDDYTHHGKNATATTTAVSPAGPGFNVPLICDYPCHDFQVMKENDILFFYNVLVLSRDMLTVSLPLIVVRGLTIKYVWERFKMRLYFLHSEEERLFWKSLMRFVDNLHPNTTTDTMFSFIIPLLGLGSGILGRKHF